MSSNAIDERKVLTELTGNTLHVYWYLFKKKQNPTGVREVQKALGFSSSSSADYHLQKLLDLGLIDKNSFGNYRIKKIVKVGVMKSFLFVGRTVFPKHLLYAISTSAMIVLFFLWFAEVLSPIVFAALSPGILAAAIFWYETLIVWKSIPTRLIGSNNSTKRSKV